MKTHSTSLDIWKSFVTGKHHLSLCISTSDFTIQNTYQLPPESAEAFFSATLATYEKWKLAISLPESPPEQLSLDFNPPPEPSNSPPTSPPIPSQNA